MKTNIIVLKVILHAVTPIPLMVLAWKIVANQLGPDPAEHVVRELGFWGMTILWLSLLMTPLRIMTGYSAWISLRRGLGLWAFAYISLHGAAFLTVWSGLDWGVISEEITKRPYVVLGLLGWGLLVPMAVTSTQAARRKLGRRWLLLHKLVYLVSVLAMLHLAFVAKLDYVKPLMFAITMIFFFFIRISVRQKQRSSIKCAPSA